MNRDSRFKRPLLGRPRIRVARPEISLMAWLAAGLAVFMGFVTLKSFISGDEAWGFMLLLVVLFAAAGAVHQHNFCVRRDAERALEHEAALHELFTLAADVLVRHVVPCGLCRGRLPK